MTKATDILTNSEYATTPAKIKHLEANSKIVRIEIEPVYVFCEIEYRLEDNSSLILTSRSRSYTWRAA